MPPAKGLFSRRKHSTDNAFGPMQFQNAPALYSEEGGASQENPTHRSETTSSSGRVAMSLLSPLPSSGKQKRAQAGTSGSAKTAPVVTASLGSNGGPALVFAPALGGRRVISTNSSQGSQSYQKSAGHQSHQSYNGSSTAMSAAYLSQAPTNGTTASEKPKKNSILPARSKSDVNKLSTFQRITGKRTKSEKDKDKEREKELKERERAEKDSKHSQFGDSGPYIISINNGGTNRVSFDQGDPSLDFRLQNSHPSRQPRHHQQQYQPQSGLRLEQNPQIYSEAELRPNSAGSTLDSDEDIPPTPPTKSPVKEEFQFPPPVPAHTVPLPTSPPPLPLTLQLGDNSRPPLLSPLDFEFETVHPLVLDSVLEAPVQAGKTESDSTTPPASPHGQHTRSDSHSAASVSGVMSVYNTYPPARFDTSYDWSHHGNPNGNKPPSPITPTKVPEIVGLGIGIPIMQSENLERVLRSSSSNLLNPQKSSNDSLVMENDLLRKALLQKNEVIKSLDPSRIMEKNDGPKSETTRVNQVLCKRVQVLEEALTSKEGAYKRAQDRAKELKEAHQDLVETIRTSHAKEVARLKTTICKLENPTLILSSNFDGLGINFDDGPGQQKEDGLRGMLDDLDGLRGQTQRMEKLIQQRTYELDKSPGKSKTHLSPFTLPPLPQRSGSAPTNGKFLPDTAYKQIEELKQQLKEERKRRKEAEWKLEEAAARARADMESALMDNERIREAENSKHLVELRRTIEEERKLTESTKRELVDAGELVDQMRRDRDELVEHEERMRQEVSDELTELRQNYDDLMSRYEEATEEADSLRQVVDAMSQEVDAGKKEVLDLKDERQKLLDKANEIMESLRREKKRSKQLNSQIQRSGSVGSTNLDVEPPLTPISPNAPGTFSDADTQQLRILVESKTRELENLHAENSQLREHLGLFQLDGKNFRKDLKKRDTKIQKLQTKISELQAVLEQKSDAIQNLEEAVALEKRMAAPSGEGLGSPTDNPGMMAGRVSAIKDENLQLKARLRHYEEEYKTTFDDAATLRRKLETFTAQQAIVLSDLENNVSRLRREKTELETSSARKINKLKLMLTSATLPPQENQPLSYSALPSLGSETFFVPQQYPEYPPTSISRKPTLEIASAPNDPILPGPVSDSDIPGRTLSGRRRKSESRKNVKAHHHQHHQHPEETKRKSLETPLPSPPPKDIHFNPAYTAPIKPGPGGSRHTFGSGSRPQSLKMLVGPPPTVAAVPPGKHDRKASVVSAMSSDVPKERVQRKASVVSDLKKEEDELVIYW